jgi:hypothetical protein
MGIHPFWAAAKERVESGNPGHVTKRMVYDNYLLASDLTILNEYSDMIEMYLEANLLPPVQYDVHSWYWADKVYFVNYHANNPTEWHKRMGNLNSGLGTELQGDLHLVIVQSDAVNTAPDTYLIALKAYWQNSEVFGDNVISKNSIIVVLGTEDGNTVKWARAITGMPGGNEHMITAISRQLKGLPIEPETIIGSLQGEIYTRESDGKTKVRALHPDPGALENIIWGLDDPKTQFVRISMTGNDEDDVGGGYLHLEDEIRPSLTQMAVIIFVTTLGTMIVWFVFVYIGERRNYPWRRNRGYYRY